ncbi:hypothetical protein MY5147_008163 [Beauveria neobassiana]
MSTPATAVAATLPHYHHSRHYHSPYAAHQQQYPASPAYRSAAPVATSGALLPPSPAVAGTAHLLPAYTRPSPLHLRRHHVDDPSAPTHGLLDHPPPPPPHAYLDPPGYTSATRPDDSFASNMSSATMTATAESRKRRRSKEPDWNNFYRNGLPKEIIVIDDTPEPEANQGRKLTHGHTTSSHIITPDGSMLRHQQLQQPQPTKRRRRDNPNPPVHYHIQPVNGSHATPPHHNITPGASTLSSDGHRSTAHTTAATSLSSNGYPGPVTAPLKRKRTRQQVAIEAKRRDIEGLGHPFEAYVPPPYPPKKAGDVYVRVVHDPQPSKSVKVDDDDGHYVVEQDADLTDKFLHDLNLIHTDLKPENILLYDNSYQTFTYHRKIPSASTTIDRQATQRRVLLDTEIRLIDFGSATFEDEYHSSVVSTRHYRAPEIILGLGWSFPCDIWSIGCILVEFFTGDALFQTHDNLEHLAMMEAVIGQRIDAHLVQAVNKISSRTGSNPASKYFKRLKLDYPTPDTSRSSKRFVRGMKNLDNTIPKNTTFFKNFHDLLRKMFVYDPSQRITAREALNHPWFKEMAPPDDGTEAAKIRMEKRRSGQGGQKA